MHELEANETVAFCVDAHNPDNAVGLILKTVCTYHIVANPGDWWVDFYIPCKANGYPSFPWMVQYESKRRIANANWFAASAYIQETKQSFVIGEDWSGAPPADGQLICFANDVPKMYWNNWGSIRFSITRVT